MIAATESSTRTDLLRKHLREPLPLAWGEPFHETWLQHEGVDFPVRFGRAHAAEMAAARPYIKPGELVIGGNALRPVVTSLSNAFQTGIRLDRERLESLKAEMPEAEAELAELDCYWTKWLSENPERRPFTCHASPAWERALTMGIDGMREYAERWRAVNVAQRPDCAPWHEGLIATIDGISAYIEAHARAAEDAAAEAETFERREELGRIASACRNVAHRAPESFHEAVQLFYILFVLNGHDSPGPIDQYLYPALKSDLESGTLPRDEAQEILDCLYLKFEEKTAYGSTIGGQHRDGTDASNELSLMCVSSIRRLRLLSPRTALRWHRGLSPELFEAACESIASGATYPAMVNDEIVIPAMVERGVSLEDAREYTFVGCGQVYPHGRGHGNYEDVVINSAKPLEFALNDGVDPMTGERVGLATGEPESFRTYGEFERAYRQQMDHLITAQIEAVNRNRRRISGHTCDFMQSLLTWSCVERGLDWHSGGTDYSEGMVDMVGMTTVTDSLVVLKRAVFQDQTISLNELVEALNRDWEGQEQLRLYLLRRIPKFGNQLDEADEIAAAEVNRVNEHIKSHKTAFGGPWGIDIIGWSGAVIYGEHTGATPDGRRRGEAVADCAGPAQGRNVSGLTPTLHSTLKLPHRTSHGPMALSLRFSKQAVRTDEDRAKLQAVIETYFREGGQQLQISIASTEEMKAAQREPETHAGLMVRVGGFSAYFTQLSKNFQDDMIARSEMGL